MQPPNITPVQRILDLLGTCSRLLPGVQLTRADAIELEDGIRRLLQTLWDQEDQATPPAKNPVTASTAASMLKDIYSRRFRGVDRT